MQELIEKMIQEIDPALRTFVLGCVSGVFLTIIFLMVVFSAKANEGVAAKRRFTKKDIDDANDL